jgi:16S rRNA (cytosine1402-N4)-methyltransferase
MLLDRLGDGVRVLGIDRDPDAVGRVSPHQRLTVVQGNFGEMNAILEDQGIEEISGVLFDFGVSSHQLDASSRGFSYRHDGPLDMRMGPDADRSAHDLVNHGDRSELTRLIGRLGEEKFAARISRAIVSDRPINTTSELAEIVRNAIPAATRRTGGHPARKTFQALRMAVNDELTVLAAGLEHGLEALAPGGRCVTIAYHSLEDRIVKRRFREGAGRIDTYGLPIEPVAEFAEITRKPLWPSDEEIEGNPRARSARLRAVEKLPQVSS